MKQIRIQLILQRADGGIEMSHKLTPSEQQSND